MKTNFLVRAFLAMILSMAIASCSVGSNQEQSSFDGNLKVLVLGNSILKHGPQPAIGWTGNWGMAASGPDKDFISLYTNSLIESGSYQSVEVESQNIAAWEQDFNHDLMQYVDINTDTYDLIVIRLGENVTDLEHYSQALDNLVNTFKTENTKVIVTDLIWSSQEKEIIQREFALQKGYQYIPYLTFRDNPTHYAYGQYEDDGIEAHPSDLGMIRIADDLFNRTNDIFLNE